MKNLLLSVLVMSCLYANAQENLTYQKPPKEILDLVDVKLAPSVLMDDDKNYMILRYSNAYKTIAELSEEELRLGGLRINPQTNIGSRTNYYNDLKVLNLKTKNSEAKAVSGMPDNPRFAYFTWSPNQKYIAMTQTTPAGVEIWVLDVETATISKITDATVNANLRDPISWFEDSQSMLVKFTPEGRGSLINSDTSVPTGPTISVNAGKKAQNRTYQDLLKNPNDEYNFQTLAISEMYKVSLNGTKVKWMDQAMYNNISFSPDGNYVMVRTVEKPFSYLVPYSRFPSKTAIYSKDAQLIQVISEVPLIEDLPQGRMAARTGPRNFSWRNDMPASLTYVEVLDGGDPAVEAEFRDELFQMEAPFKGNAKSILKTVNRFRRIDWGNENIAVAYDYWWDNRNIKTYLFNPSKSGQEVNIISDRSSQDRYSDPGRFVKKANEFGSDVIALEGSSAFLIGDGFSAEGQFPFLDKFDLNSLKKERLYQSAYTDKLESIRDFDHESKKIMVVIESKNDFPNYYFRDQKRKKLAQLTTFENPFKSIQDVDKEVITYYREDGLELSGTLYLPVGYDKTTKEKMPMILWAYPREYKDASSAAQVTSNPNRFTRPYWGSPIYWVTRGYVVLDGAAFPIVGAGDDEPNDTFRSQLVANAKAAIDAVDELGYIDRNKVAVGGHSYGAFMVANLLSHSDLFAAGIARSGAYNRTLTPFGFQSEQRNYWEAPEVYYTMSPFMHADKMKTPLLLTHGEADNNSGTYPMQSERYFNALKGLGSTVRLVMFPKESHGYRAKESILHLLWEQDQWLEKYVKAPVPEPSSE